MVQSTFPGQANWEWYWWDEVVPGIHGPDVEKVDLLVQRISEAELVAFDTETTSLDETQATLVAMSFAWRAEGTVYAETVCFDERADWSKYPLSELREWIENPLFEKVLANAKYDMNVLRHSEDIHLTGVAWDTMIADQVLHDDEREHGLDACSLRYLGLKKIPTGAVFNERLGWGPVPRADLALYANEDVVAALCVAEFQRAEAMQDELFDTVDLEMRVLPYVAEMEFNGARIDVDRLATLTVEFAKVRDEANARAQAEAAGKRAGMAVRAEMEFAELDKRWRSYGGPKDRPKALDKARNKARARVKMLQGPVNLASSSQLSELLYDEWELHRKLGLRHPPKTKKGQPSTDKHTMPKLAPYSKFVQAVMDWREVAKLLSTYTEKLPHMRSPVTGRVHPSFRQCGAGTGRFTCSDPNLQNIPIRTELGHKLRECFIPAEGYVLVALDYSQIEPRLVAHLSQEPVWLEAFRTGEDLYTATAKAIWSDIPRDATKADIPRRRYKAKTVTLAMLYGAGAAKVANEAKITVDEAKALIEAFWIALPTLRKWIDKQVVLAREAGGFVYTPWGRRRHLNDIDHRWSGPRATAERQAANHPVQGGAADILKMAMAELWLQHILADFDPGAWRPILQIHDELVFEVLAGREEEFIPWAAGIMENVVELSVPLKAEGSAGATWAEAH